jgi:hypothetical protein
MAADASEGPDEPVSVDIDIENGETTVTVTGERNAAVVVRSTSGERVYLPPEAEPEDGETGPYDAASTPYDGVSDSPYGGADDTPYGSARQQGPEWGVTPTARGFRVHHPEPAWDVRLLRGRQSPASPASTDS